MSKLGKTRLVFVQPGTKINSNYYCSEVLSKGLLPDICQLSDNNFILQHDGAQSHRSRHTVAFLKQNVPNFIEPGNWPPNSTDLNPVDYAIVIYCFFLISSQKLNCRKWHFVNMNYRANLQRIFNHWKWYSHIVSEHRSKNRIILT